MQLSQDSYLDGLLYLQVLHRLFLLYICSHVIELGSFVVERDLRSFRQVTIDLRYSLEFLYEHSDILVFAVELVISEPLHELA